MASESWPHKISVLKLKEV